MKYPFENNEKGYPILDTEEKLQWYVNTLLHHEVDLYEIGAEVDDLETVWLKRRRTYECQQCLTIPFCDPTFSASGFRKRVHRSAVDVLRAVHARREAELQVKRDEEKNQRVEFIKAHLKQQADEAEKAMKIIADDIASSKKKTKRNAQTRQKA